MVAQITGEELQPSITPLQTIDHLQSNTNPLSSQAHTIEHSPKKEIATTLSKEKSHGILKSM